MLQIMHNNFIIQRQREYKDNTSRTYIMIIDDLKLRPSIQPQHLLLFTLSSPTTGFFLRRHCKGHFIFSLNYFTFLKVYIFTDRYKKIFSRHYAETKMPMGIENNHLQAIPLKKCIPLSIEYHLHWSTYTQSVNKRIPCEDSVNIRLDHLNGLRIYEIS